MTDVSIFEKNGKIPVRYAIVEMTQAEITNLMDTYVEERDIYADMLIDILDTNPFTFYNN